VGSLSNFRYRIENPDSVCCLVVDCGYSFTHVAPYVQGERVKEAVKRIDLGGKLLTNYLKEVISYRYLCSVGQNMLTLGVLQQGRVNF